MNIDLSAIDPARVLLRSDNALGHGNFDDLTDVVYVKTDDYSAGNNPLIAEEIERLNAGFLAEGRHYVLIGPGRWGSSDPWLGVPVKWPAISAARLIVEAGLTNYRVDPSQGTHFSRTSPLSVWAISPSTIISATGSTIVPLSMCCPPCKRRRMCAMCALPRRSR